ncbi:NUDIX domain-containing protein [Anaerocolumna sedimenticola]|uniref:NUDIX domain-containing protein n=1 Tax=Anaerocolumna sedimenticola TaxID=2696063 RepID=A0A6P1TP74_9FIRM|nr:NUDIX domain-containing protein [Anaerocolumna sedimenticola]QHQ62009.1 NUDIX domain-containing protein [Anaerocolumna sedimenticola]
MELWDVYDINRIKANKTMVRGESFEIGNYHLVIHVCIFNSEGNMLIQQRQPFKEGWPNMWDITAGGSATKGDTSQSAAERELFEEIGLRLDLKDIRPHITINFSNGFDDVYLLEKDVDISKLSLQYDEVQNVKWASKEEIFLMIERGEFIPYYPSLIQLLFDIRKQYGCHQTK